MIGGGSVDACIAYVEGATVLSESPLCAYYVCVLGLSVRTNTIIVMITRHRRDRCDQHLSFSRLQVNTQPVCMFGLLVFHTCLLMHACLLGCLPIGMLLMLTSRVMLTRRWLEPGNPSLIPMAILQRGSALNPCGI